MKNYKVSFFKVEKEKDEKGKMIKTGEKYLGSVVVDDSGVDNQFTLTAKAFRHASSNVLMAEKVIVERL